MPATPPWPPAEKRWQLQVMRAEIPAPMIRAYSHLRAVFRNSLLTGDTPLDERRFPLPGPGGYLAYDNAEEKNAAAGKKPVESVITFQLFVFPGEA